MKQKGARLFVCTNKPDSFAKRIVEKMYGPSFFEEVCGQIEGLPVKPDPRIPNYLLEKYHLNKEETLFVGDSKTDVQTGINAGLKIALCLWGYGFYTPDLLEKTDFLFHSPKELEDSCGK